MPTRRTTSRPSSSACECRAAPDRDPDARSPSRPRHRCHIRRRSRVPDRPRRIREAALAPAARQPPATSRRIMLRKIGPGPAASDEIGANDAWGEGSRQRSRGRYLTPPSGRAPTVSTFYFLLFSTFCTSSFRRARARRYGRHPRKRRTRQRGLASYARMRLTPRARRCPLISGPSHARSRCADTWP